MPPNPTPDVGRSGRARFGTRLATLLIAVAGGVLMLCVVFAVRALLPAAPGAADNASISAQMRQAREAARHYAASPAPIIGAQPPVGALTARPGTLPPMIAASGECADLLHSIRDLIDRYPSGLSPRTTADQASLQVYLQRLADPQDSPCTAATQQAFRTQELGPWMTWAP